MSLYRGMDRATLDAAYDVAEAIGHSKRWEYVAARTKRTEAIRPSLKGKFDLRYGSTPRERIDFFTCGRPNAPTFAFIHGGNWQVNDKESFGYLAKGILPAGFNLALIEYTLAPDARMDRIVAEIRRAVDWLLNHAIELGGDPQRVYVGGHSAGGHLTALAMSDSRIAGGIGISGIYDLEPIRLSFINEKIALDEAESRRNSPIFHLPPLSSPLVVAVGLDELPEFVRQSAAYAEALSAKGLPVISMQIEARDHFSILDEFDTGGRLLDALEQLGNS